MLGKYAGAVTQQPSPWNVPNALTVFRILLVPVFLWLLLAADGLDPALRLWAFGVFALAMITDKIDGDLARKHNLVTDFGKIADPIADKALLGAALIGLALVMQLPWWVPVTILIRELLITVLRFAVIRFGVMPASRGGKLKTVLQTAGIGLFLLLRPLDAVLGHDAMLIITIAAWIVMVAAVVVTVVTGIDYIVKAVRLVRTAQREPRG
ncbi:hypothetical protein GCM10027079_01180 [Sediminivirga luteola]|uniref:CDP-diacylglycerol--glycerol-3-phosphate 3-phosphatidyltransferase n=1 Tax=Sediminivirga luteola TaxID=1774748 RepID=A0A8J2XK95_9MICO|nr:hypothetical protein GCM10011333_13460 [Sediminivirga luteola]